MTTVALPLPAPVAVSDRPTGRVAARALRRSLVPGAREADVAAELVELAGWRRPPLLGALVRIERAGDGSAVVERASRYLRSALDLAGLPTTVSA